MPSQVTVRIEGLDRLRAGFNRWASTIAPICRDTIQEAMHRALVTVLAGYSQPQRGYARTGNLFRGTNVEVEGNSVRLVSSAYRDGQEYSGYVLGTGDGTPPGYGQAAVHQDYWVPSRKAVDDQVKLLEAPGGELKKRLETEGKADIE